MQILCVMCHVLVEGWTDFPDACIQCIICLILRYMVCMFKEERRSNLNNSLNLDFEKSLKQTGRGP